MRLLIAGFLVQVQARELCWRAVSGRSRSACLRHPFGSFAGGPLPKRLGSGYIAHMNRTLLWLLFIDVIVGVAWCVTVLGREAWRLFVLPAKQVAGPAVPTAEELELARQVAAAAAAAAAVEETAAPQRRIRLVS